SAEIFEVPQRGRNRREGVGLGAKRGAKQLHQKKVLRAEETVYSSSTTYSNCHLSKVVQGCETPKPSRSPTPIGMVSGNRRYRCWSFMACVRQPSVGRCGLRSRPGR